MQRQLHEQYKIQVLTPQSTVKSSEDV
ncbi:hypothetical protein LINPERHAP2_LOCUS40331 [Linum perenne]